MKGDVVMTIQEYLQEIRTYIDVEKAEQYDGFIAIQITLTKEPEGMFYIELKDHHLSIEPYDYYDRNAALTIAPDTLRNILKRRLDPVIAFTTGKLKIDGDPGKVLELLKYTKSKLKK